MPLTNFERNIDFHTTDCVNALFLADMHLAIKLLHKHFSSVTKGMFLKTPEIFWVYFKCHNFLCIFALKKNGYLLVVQYVMVSFLYSTFHWMKNVSKGNSY